MEGRIVGMIIPAREEGEKPMFEIIRRDGWQKPTAEVRACEHRRFTLDEKWATVTCGECGSKVDPFAALMHYATAYDTHVKQEMQRVREAEKSLHVAELKRLVNLRDISEEEAAEIAGLLARQYERSVEELRDAARRIRDTIRDRKVAKRTKRRQKKATEYQRAVERSRAAITLSEDQP